ncbi:MAG: proline--tRNA ligase [Victivallaceae bacterium]
MRTSQLFFKTVKNSNSKKQYVASYELLEQAGYLSKLSKGIFTYTPLMYRVVSNFCGIVRQELNKIGGQELMLPLLQPAEIWKTTGRWEEFLSEKLLYTLKDREDKFFCIAPTHEEAVCGLVAERLKNHKQLPLHLYQIAAKFRDEIRPRFGLMRTKELLMEDSYTFSESEEQMQEQYLKLRGAYSNIFRRLELEFVIVDADGGKIGKGKSEEFQVLCDIGEDAVCVSDDYGSNIETAKTVPPHFNYRKCPDPVTEVKTPGIKTIKSLSEFLNVPEQLILKTFVYKLTCTNGFDFIAVGIRGDRQLNTTKIKTCLGATDIAPASEEEIIELLGVGPGFIGPLNCPITFVADLSTEAMTGFICAGNKEDVHYVNVNWDRDISSPTRYDFLLVEEGDVCPSNPGTPYAIKRGVEVAHIFNLGLRYTQIFNVTFQDRKGTDKICWMGTYGIGIGRTLAACVEQKHDEKGIVWPLEVAPFKITVIVAKVESTLIEEAEKLYRLLTDHGYDPLFDDRDERLGFKLKDSDLIGIPYKIIIGKEFLNSGKFEIESRTGEKFEVAPESFLNWCDSHLNSLNLFRKIAD